MLTYDIILSIINTLIRIEAMSVTTGGVVGVVSVVGICCCIGCCSLVLDRMCNIFARGLAAEIHPDLTIDQMHNVITQIHEIEDEGRVIERVEVTQIVQRILGRGTPPVSRVDSPVLDGNNSLRVGDLERDEII